jgi:hypothetical protein
MIPEWSFIIDLSTVELPKSYNLAATANECIALAKRFEIGEIHHLSAEFSITNTSEHGHYLLSGILKSQILQDPVSINSAPFVFSIPLDVLLTENSLDLYMDDDRDIEPLEDMKLDVAELMAQIFYVSLTPYIDDIRHVS